MPDTTGGRSLTGRRGEDHWLGLCYAMLLGGLQSTLFYMLQDGGCQKRSLRQDLLSPSFSSILQFSPPIWPLHIYPCICSVAPCLRVLWMSTHGCFLLLFPLPFYLVVATRCWSPGAKRHRRRRPLLHWRCLLLRAARKRRPGVV